MCACWAGGISQGPPLTIYFRSSNGSEAALSHSVCLAEGSEESSDWPTKPKVTRKTCQLEPFTPFICIDPTLCGKPGNLWGTWFSSRWVEGEEVTVKGQEMRRSSPSLTESSLSASPSHTHLLEKGQGAGSGRDGTRGPPGAPIPSPGSQVPALLCRSCFLGFHRH